MISVLNLQQLLSGNKYLFLICLFLISCGGSKKAVQKRPSTKITKVKPKKPTKKVEEKVIVKDTTDWGDEEPIEEAEENNPIDVEDPLLLKDSYNVSMFIPFDVNSSASEISGISNKFANYYGGVLLALADLDTEGLRLNVKVFDSKEDFENKLKDPFNKNADVLIGPYDSKRLKTIAEFGKENKIPVLSPWKASKKITKQNPYYVQLSPNPSDHFKKIVDHVDENFDPKQVFLLKRNNSKDETLAKVLQRYHKKKGRDGFYNEFEVSEDSLQLGDVAYDSLFYYNPETVIIIPNYSSRDEGYIYNAIRRISTERGFQKVYIYGMPILMSSNRFTYDYYQNLNLRACVSKLVSRNYQDIRDFEKRYYNAYGTLPSDDAFEGYDMMTYVGKGLLKYGKTFHKKLVGEEHGLLQTIYNLDGIKPSAPMDLEGEPQVEYYQNIHLDIIQYQDGGFKRL